MIKNKMKKWRQFALISFMCLVTKITLAQSSVISMDFQSIPIQDALRIIAKNLHQNIVISPQVAGNISLHLQRVTAEEAFYYVLNAHGLSRFQQNQVWFVLPQTELLRQKQAESQLQDMLIATAPLESRVWQIRYAKVIDVAHLLQDANHSLLSKRGYLHVDQRTNQLLIQDISQNIAVIEQLVRRMDVPVKQILIEARLASVDSDFERELGINFAVQPPSANAAINPLSTLTDTAPRYGLVVAKLADSSLLDVQLAALENTGHGELISSPSLFAANQQPASIESGEEIPYQEVSRGGGTGVAFKKAVFEFKGYTQILPNNQVLLELQVNQDRPSNRVVLGVPAIDTRQISTNVLVANGHTVVLGGIYESNQGENTEGIPWVSHLPLIGFLFQQHHTVRNKRELLIFVTPKIVG